MPAMIINPVSLARPRGFSHGVVAGGRMLFVAGQVGWNAAAEIVSDRFDEQFDQALANVLAVVVEAGGTPASLCRLTIYVVDKSEYVNAQKAIGERYRARMGRHYPAMTLVEVSGLLEPGARVEIEATAMV
jgi:enamine deaminase RidA (YjgF/YER057c/UK114 family)